MINNLTKVMLKFISSGEIQNHNAIGLCIEKICNKKETHYHVIRIDDIELSMPFCEEHYEKMENIERKNTK